MSQWVILGFIGILISLPINRANAQCLEPGFLEDHEWRIHGVAVQGNEFQDDLVLRVARDVTLQDAREWCLQEGNCASLVFDFKSTKSLLTVDHVVFCKRSLPYCNATITTSKDVSFRVAHVLKEKTEEPRTIYPYYNPYRHCCHEHAKQPWPTLQQLHQASNIERTSCNISRAQFVKDYESTHTPVILEGCAKDWPAMTKWKGIESFQFSNHTMWKNECKGVRDPWHQVLEDFHNRQNAGIFERIDANGEKSKLLQDFHVPAPFLTSSYEDFAASVVEKMGKMRFFSIGQQWFASDPHQDFHLPSPEQWNTLVRGTKLWALFPPTDLIVDNEWNIKCDPDCSTLQEPVFAYYWFKNVAFHVHKLVYENGMRPLLFLQHPGDTVYIPDKWEHALINLDDCIAVTQGYGSLHSNLEDVWKQILVKGNEKDWRKVYYTVLNATQRQIVRDEVKEDEVCVQYYGDDATDWNELCKNHVFYSQTKKSRRG